MEEKMNDLAAWIASHAVEPAIKYVEHFIQSNMEVLTGLAMVILPVAIRIMFLDDEH